MEHDQAEDLFSDLLDGRLRGEDGRAVEEHLSGCARCRDSLREWERLRSGVFHAPVRPGGIETEAFVRALMARLPAGVEEPEDSLTLDRRWLVPAMSFAFAALVLSFVPIRAATNEPVSVLLSEDGASSGVLSWAGRAAPETPEELVGFLMEE